MERPYSHPRAATVYMSQRPRREKATSPVLLVNEPRRPQREMMNPVLPGSVSPNGSNALGVESSPTNDSSHEADGLDEGAAGNGDVICESSGEGVEEAVPSEVP